MSDSVQPHRRQRTRLPYPWDSPGRNIGVACHVLLQCMKLKSESEVTQLCPTLSDLMNCSLPGSSVRGIFQARVLEWGAITFSESHHKYLANGRMTEYLSVTVFKLSIQTCALPISTHSNVPAWRIPGTGEPGGLPSRGSHRVGHD